MNEATRMKLIVPVSEQDHTLGSAAATVTVVTYGDYQCPDCHKLHHETQKMIDELVHSVQFVYRHFPLVKVHPNALRAAEAAEAAAAQGKFWETHRRLYDRPDKLSDRNLRSYAREIGLDLDRYDREMKDRMYAPQILKSYYDSMLKGITGAPTTFIDGALYGASGVDLLMTVKTMAEKQSRPFKSNETT
jgi:protein-disulfide isomerase